MELLGRQRFMKTYGLVQNAGLVGEGALIPYNLSERTDHIQ